MTTQMYKQEGADIPVYRTYTLSNFRDLPQLQDLPEDVKWAMEVVGNVLPFKTNSYVINELIDWSNIPKDPMFVLTFPQKTMLSPEHFSEMEKALKTDDKKKIKETANSIRLQLNPNPAGQMEHNVPMLKDGTKLI